MLSMIIRKSNLLKARISGDKFLKILAVINSNFFDLILLLEQKVITRTENVI